MSSSESSTKSLFVSIPGLVILLAGTILSAYFRLGFLPFFLFVVTLVATLSFLWGRYSLTSLEVETRGESSRVFPGEEISVTFSLSNNKYLPLLWLETVYFQNEPKCLSSMEGFSRKFSWIRPKEKVEWDVSFRGERRGVQFLSEVSLRSGDGFSLSEETKTMEVENKLLLVVYPKVFSLDASELVRDTLEMQPGQRGYIEDHSLFKGSRDYSPGDNSRFINWRVLARQNQLSVNLYEAVVPECVTFLLDLESFARYEEESTSSGSTMVLAEFREEAFEEMLSLVASSVLALSERKVRSALLIPRIILSQEQVVPSSFLRPDDMDAQVPELLTMLSRIEYKGERSLLSSSDIASVAHTLGEVFVVTYSPEDMTLRKALERLSENQVTLLSYLEGKGAVYRTKTLKELKKTHA